MDATPTPPPSRAAATKPSKRKYMGLPAWVIVVVALFIVGGIVGAIDKKKDDTPTSPSGGVELCDMMRDPSNDVLEASDIRRMSGWNQTQLERYVRGRCPDLLWRIDG